jgi:uncharacterized protein (TIGR03546 family)
MLFLQLVGKLVKLLRSAAAPFQIAGGFILGMMLGFIGVRTLIAAPIVLCIIVLNVNLASVIFAAILFRFIAYLIDPFIHALGYWILVDIEPLRSVWTTLYSMKFVPYTRFNNTVVMGSFIIAIILLAPLYIAVKKFIVAYKQKYEPRIQKWKIIQALRSSALVRWFTRVKNLAG